MAAAWTATKWVIKTTPPAPPPVDDRAGASGGTPAGDSTYGAPPDTALAVLTLQHDVIVTSLGMVGANPTLDRYPGPPRSSPRPPP